jgi:hypothetical protein
MAFPCGRERFLGKKSVLAFLSSMYQIEASLDAALRLKYEYAKEKFKQSKNM